MPTPPPPAYAISPLDGRGGGSSCRAGVPRAVASHPAGQWLAMPPARCARRRPPCIIPFFRVKHEWCASGIILAYVLAPVALFVGPLRSGPRPDQLGDSRSTRGRRQRRGAGDVPLTHWSARPGGHPSARGGVRGREL